LEFMQVGGGLFIYKDTIYKKNFWH